MTREEAVAILIDYFKPPIMRNDGKSMAHLLALEAIEKAVEALEAEPRFGEWISVDNPPKVERYETLDILVTDGESITNGYATLDPFDDDSDEVEIHGRFPIDNKNIKWWMPLPKLPKGEEK